MDILFSIQNQRLRCHSTDVYVEGSRDYLDAVFKVSEDWNESIITVYFKHDGSDDIVGKILDENMSCKVPTQVIEDGEVKVWARGDSTQTITTNEVTLTIYNTGEFDVGADLYNQVITMMRETKDMANAAVSGAGGALESADRADAAAQQAEAHAATAAADRRAVEELADQVLYHEVAWDDIKNKPTEFTPAAHLHDQSDILELEQRLAELEARIGSGSGGGTESSPTSRVISVMAADGMSAVKSLNNVSVGVYSLYVEEGCPNNPIGAVGDLRGICSVDEWHDDGCYYGWMVLTDKLSQCFAQQVYAGDGTGWARLDGNSAGGSDAVVPFTIGDGLEVTNNTLSLRTATSDQKGGVVLGDEFEVNEHGKLSVSSLGIEKILSSEEELIFIGGSAAD